MSRPHGGVTRSLWCCALPQAKCSPHRTASSTAPDWLSHAVYTPGRTRAPIRLSFSGLRTALAFLRVSVQGFSG
eukprot:8341551-Pyramimonas_sp.AAC.1